MSNSRFSITTWGLICVTASLVAGLAVPAPAQSSRPLPIRIDPRSEASSKRLELITFTDSVYHRSRRIWIYTPPGYDSKAAVPYPLIIAFDGSEYRDTMPLPFILDTLAAARRAPAFVGVLIDNFEGADRIRDLGNAAKMTGFLSMQLIPYVRAHWHVTTDPHRVILTGSSAGGLGSAFVAFQRPDMFGNVLSQSGAFWRGAEASNSPPYEWLTAKVSRSPKRDVRYFLDVGEMENHPTLGGSGPNFLEANRRFRDALKSKGYSVMYAEVPGGQHAAPYWMDRLPVGIVAIVKLWSGEIVDH
jgi:enterochelin esterase-like enzyme